MELISYYFKISGSKNNYTVIYDSQNHILISLLMLVYKYILNIFIFASLNWLFSYTKVMNLNCYEYSWC